MSKTFARGPFLIWTQNLADEDAYNRIEDDVRRVLVELAGPDVRLKAQEIHRARMRIHRLLDGKLGSIWRHGRATVNIFRNAADREAYERKLGELHAEWSIKLRQHSYGIDVSVDLDGDHEIGGSLRVPGLGLYLYAELPARWRKWLQARLGRSCERELGFRYMEGGLWLHLWSHPGEWSSRAPFTDPTSSKRQPVIHLNDLFFGEEKVTHEELERLDDATLYLSGSEDPESERYTVTAVRTLSTWRRPRWPWPKQVMRVSFEIPAGIPIPGKGDNGWDCDDDATHGYSTTAETIEEAAQQLIANIRKTRLQRGGEDWKPAPKTS